jgi:hypothetical protein
LSPSLGSQQGRSDGDKLGVAVHKKQIRRKKEKEKKKEGGAM